MYNFGPYTVLLTITTNIAVLLVTAFGLQGHIYKCSLNVPKQIVTFKKYEYISTSPTFQRNNIHKLFYT